MGKILMKEVHFILTKHNEIEQTIAAAIEHFRKFRFLKKAFGNIDF